MTREHKFLSGNRGNLCVKIFGRDSMPPVREKTRVDTRDKRRETTRDCEGCKYRSPSGKLVSSVVPWEKRVSGDPILPVANADGPGLRLSMFCYCKRPSCAWGVAKACQTFSSFTIKS